MLEELDDGTYLLRQSQQPCKLSPIHDKASVPQIEIAADEKSVAPVLLHRREVKCLHVRQRAAVRQIPLPQINRALDIAPLVGLFSRDDLRGVPFGLYLVQH